jgi:hypothetical protein
MFRDQETTLPWGNVRMLRNEVKVIRAPSLSRHDAPAVGGGNRYRTHLDLVLTLPHDVGERPSAKTVNQICRNRLLGTSPHIRSAALRTDHLP